MRTRFSSSDRRRQQVIARISHHELLKAPEKVLLEKILCESRVAPLSNVTQEIEWRQTETPGRIVSWLGLL
jgi:hypothetical protein